jgi:hypothetical protein
MSEFEFKNLSIKVFDPAIRKSPCLLTGSCQFGPFPTGGGLCRLTNTRACYWPSVVTGPLTTIYTLGSVRCPDPTPWELGFDPAVINTGPVLNSREELTHLKAQLQENLATVEEHMAAMEEAARPSSIEEIDALEAHLKGAMEELKARRAELQKKK